MTQRRPDTLLQKTIGREAADAAEKVNAKPIAGAMASAQDIVIALGSSTYVQGPFTGGSFTANAQIVRSDYYDFFDRTVVGSLGTATDGTDWTDDSVMDVTPGYAYDTVVTGSYTTPYPTLQHADIENVMVRQLMSWDVDPTTGDHWHNILLRFSDSTHYYGVQFGPETNGDFAAEFNYEDGGGWQRDISSAGWPTLDSWVDLTTERWWVEFAAIGSSPTTLEFRCWLEGTARPVAAQMTYDDSAATGLQSVGGPTSTWGGTNQATDVEYRIHSYEVWDLGASESTGSFTADAVIEAPQSVSLTADAIRLRTFYFGSGPDPR